MWNKRRGKVRHCGTYQFLLVYEAKLSSHHFQQSATYIESCRDRGAASWCSYFSSPIESAWPYWSAACSNHRGRRPAGRALGAGLDDQSPNAINPAGGIDAAPGP